MAGVFAEAALTAASRATEAARVLQRSSGAAANDAAAALNRAADALADAAAAAQPWAQAAEETRPSRGAPTLHPEVAASTAANCPASPPGAQSPGNVDVALEAGALSPRKRGSSKMPGRQNAAASASASAEPSAAAAQDRTSPSPERGGTNAQDLLALTLRHRITNPPLQPEDVQYATQRHPAAQPGAPTYQAAVTFKRVPGERYEGKLRRTEEAARESAAEAMLASICPEPAAAPFRAAASASAAAAPAAYATYAAAAGAETAARTCWEIQTGHRPPYFVNSPNRGGYKILVTGLPDWSAKEARLWAAGMLAAAGCLEPSHTSVDAGSALFTFSTGNAASWGKLQLAGHDCGAGRISQTFYWTPADYNAYEHDPRFTGYARA